MRALLGFLCLLCVDAGAATPNDAHLARAKRSPRFKPFSTRFLPGVRTTMLTGFPRKSRERLTAGWTLAPDITVRETGPAAGRLPWGVATLVPFAVKAPLYTAKDT
jgi:hypothetical protein